MEKIEKLSNDQLKITTDVIKYVKKEGLEEEKLMLECRLNKINALLNIFKEAG